MFFAVLKVLDYYFVMYLSVTAALYSKMYLFGMKLVMVLLDIY